MRTVLALLVLPALLLTGCGGSATPRTAPQEAEAACTEVGPLLSREPLRRSDVSALSRAVAAAGRAARLDPARAPLQRAVAATRAAALAVEASSKQATSNTEQSRIDDAYATARAALAEACG